MAQVPRREAILQRQAAKAGLTRCGTDWLIQALDPFHDTERNICGYPDTTASASVVQVIKQSYQFFVPTGITGNWDCNIVMLPWLNQIAMQQATANGANLVPAQNYLAQANGTSTINAGGIQVIAGASGTNCDIFTPPSGTYVNQGNSIPTTYLNGNSRCISMAMEICNTTAEINLQGLVTCYRVPVPQNDDGTTMSIINNTSGDTVGYQGSASVVYVPEPPHNIAAAQLFAGTKAWRASEGTYNVAMFNTPDVPANGVNFTQPVLFVTSQTDANVMAANFTRQVRTAVGGPATFGEALVPSVYWTEFDMSGAYFTGLSNSTTLTVNYIVEIERFPTQDDLDLIVSAERSPMYDIKALEAYSEIAQSLPVAVPFGENGWGDWFDTIANTASSILGVSSHPIARAGVALIGGAKGIKDMFDQPNSDVRISPDKTAPTRVRGPRGKKPKGGVPSRNALKKGKKKLKNKQPNAKKYNAPRLDSNGRPY